MATFCYAADASTSRSSNRTSCDSVRRSRAVEFNSGKFVVNVAGFSGADYATGFAAVDFSKMFLT